MGFLNALIESAERFHADLLPVGFSKGMIKWALDLDLTTPSNTQLVQIDADGANVPNKPPDRTSGRLSAKLLTDKAEYVLGTADTKTKEKTTGANATAAENAFGAFVKMLSEAETRLPSLLSGVTDAMGKLPKYLQSIPKSTEHVAIRLNGMRLTDRPEVAALWAEMMDSRGGTERAMCSICGTDKPSLRLFPGDLTLFQERGVKLMSVFTDREDTLKRDERGLPERLNAAFSSRGKLQLSNSPICTQCASTALQVCRHLIHGHTGATAGANFVVLARGDAALQNQLAVFWTKFRPRQSASDEWDDDEQSLTGPEAAVRIILAPQGSVDAEPPPEDAQMRHLLKRPWTGNAGVTPLTDAFFLAVLSPNKTRLVIREWMELGVEDMRDNITRYMSAVRIVHPCGNGIWFPPLPALLDALHPPKSARGADEGRRANDPHLLRELLRCAFRGELPPAGLLARAVRRFGVPEHENEDRAIRELRRMTLAAAMKLCLTYTATRKEQEAMEQLDEGRLKQPYLCGRLLAVLDEVQRQHHWPNKINTTLADRFYGTASTAPASVFANLMNIATKAHLPKLRRDGRDFITTKIEEICAALDDAGGFPPPLAPAEQAEFGLGYYHQRAKFATERREAALEKKRKAAAAKQEVTNNE